MPEDVRVGVPKYFWIVGIVCLVWNLMGVMAFIMQLTLSPEALAAMPAAERELYETMPGWVTIVFACAVFGGSLGCVALLCRKAWALPLFIISLLGVSGQMIHAFFLSKSFEVFGPGAMIMPIMVILVAIFLIWFAMTAKRKAWIS